MVADISVIPTLSAAFPEHRGLVLGLAKAFVGLSGSISSLVYTSLFRPNAEPFFLFIACEFTVITAIGFCFIRRIEPPTQNTAQDASTERRLHGAYMIVFLIAVQMGIVALVNANLGEGILPSPGFKYTSFGLFVVLEACLLWYVSSHCHCHCSALLTPTPTTIQVRLLAERDDCSDLQGPRHVSWDHHR
jgi:hypothetical protein